tara:strand:- start:3905 stop:4048 length:144 start_codon:yes stop_codon:yes gene_type:complete
VTSEGLRKDDMVVTEGVQTLREGAEVEIISQDASALLGPEKRHGASL